MVLFSTFSSFCIFTNFPFSFSGKPIGDHKCPHCDKIFQSKINLTNHIESLHDTGLVHVKDFQCKVCHVNLMSVNALLSHSQTEHQFIPGHLREFAKYKCNVCANLFISKISLSAHKAYKHNASNKRFLQKKIWQCPHCDKEFRAFGAFNEHVKCIHEGRADFECELCPRKFGSQQFLTSHIKIKHTRVTCDICGQLQYNFHYLNKHKGSAHGIIPANAFRCGQCPEWYKSKPRLEHHMKTKH